MRRNEAIELYKAETAKFEGTRVVQWKLNISAWTLAALAIPYKTQIGFRSLGTCSNDECIQSLIVSIGFGLMILIIHFWFLYRIQYSLECSKIVAATIASKLNESIGDDSNIQVNPKVTRKLFKEKSKGTFFFEWVILQVAITILLVVIFCIK